MNIEIFPAEKTCEQGCAHCPLARKERDFTAATEIHPEVQKSFSILEKALHTRNTMYDLHSTSALHLFPKVKHPKLIRMARFENGKEIRIPGNQKLFSENIKRLLEKNEIDPKIIGFSIVPSSPLVSGEDTGIIDEILTEIKGWHFKKPYKSIQVTIRSNLIDNSLFAMVSPFVFNADKLHIKKLMDEHTISLMKWKKNPPFSKKKDFYHNEYLGKSGSHRIEITNRIIVKKETKETPESYYAQAIEHCAIATKVLDFAIAPKGVMLIHTSLAINNPILWISHEDFRTALAREMKRPRPSFKKFIRNTITANIVMYKYIQAHTKENAVISHEMYMSFYERNRKKHFQ